MRRTHFRQVEPVIRSFTTIPRACLNATYRCNLSHNALQMYLRLVLLCVNIVSHGTQAILAETARTRMEGAIRCVGRWRAAGWKNRSEERRVGKGGRTRTAPREEK